MGIVDDIKRDREAGTPGAWAHKSHMDIVPMGGDADDIIASLYAGTPNADARRIARVPQLEALVLAAEDLAENFHAYACLEEDAADAGEAGNQDAANVLYAEVFKAWERAEAALTAYRKAKEAAK